MSQASWGIEDLIDLALTSSIKPKIMGVSRGGIELEKNSGS